MTYFREIQRLQFMCMKVTEDIWCVCECDRLHLSYVCVCVITVVYILLSTLSLGLMGQEKASVRVCYGSPQKIG